MTSLIYANLPKQPIDRQKPHRRQHLPLPRSGRTTQLRKCFSSEGQVPIPSRRCPAPSTDSAKLLLCKSICSAELSGRRPTPRTPHLGRGQHFWGLGGAPGPRSIFPDKSLQQKKNPTRGCRATPPSALLRQPQTSAFSASFLPRASQGLRFWRRHTWLVPPRPPKTGVLAARLQPWASDLSLPPPGSPRASRRPGQHPRLSPPRHQKK